jgi:hypothetical protein
MLCMFIKTHKEQKIAYIFKHIRWTFKTTQGMVKKAIDIL